MDCLTIRYLQGKSYHFRINKISHVTTINDKISELKSTINMTVVMVTLREANLFGHGNLSSNLDRF